MTVSIEQIKERIEVASKRKKADLVIKNGRIVDVFNHQIYQLDIAITGGVIVGVGDYEGLEIIDAQNNYVCPSFIDSHVHIESSMVPPQEFAKVVIPHGVTTVIADPHEIANVSGVQGIQYMLDSSEKLPLNVYMMLPSCVPATPFENSGAILNASDLEPLYSNPRILGLGEVMDFPSVANADERILQKLYDALVKGKKIDGHGAGLNPNAINIYAAVGIGTDHETVNAVEALDRLKKGMYLIIRQGSVAKDLPNLIEIVTDRNSRRCLFGTDDKHIDDLIHEGSIDHHVRLAIEHGIHPITAIQIASLNAAECYGLTQKGAVAPGYDADLLIVSDLEKLEIQQVFSGGKLVGDKGKYLFETDVTNVTPCTSLLESIRVSEITKYDLALEIDKNKKANIIEIIPNSLVTNHLIEEVITSQGCFQTSTEKDHLKIVVIERHSSKDNIGLGIVKGLKIKSGAIATTIAHDSHNLIAAGENDEDLLLAIEEIKKMQGGLVVVEKGEVLASLPLSISGILSQHSFHEVNEQLDLINSALLEIGASDKFNPFLTLSFLALPVIPNLKLTDLGLFDVNQFKHIKVSIE
ncbi:adenine deaminase [Litchfieldia salsa]|uniref:Adenine deaminase n=1 Tax=Litchfieldia salsa TaxID=930152 RepID=A0A1H0TCH4_9BACI|nr:adenine deaminase [Litchfieldia salsa]SDP51717.1 Adenine deaminase [Litchfieldia salsa]